MPEHLEAKPFIKAAAADVPWLQSSIIYIYIYVCTIIYIYIYMFIYNYITCMVYMDIMHGYYNII